jgi:hypothetical protein
LTPGTEHWIRGEFLKRKTKTFIDRAKNSIIMAIELFNRPSEMCRVEGVVLFLDHSFEMLLKAIIFEKTGRLRGNKEKVNFGFDKCLNICESHLNLINKDQGLILRDINDFRDIAVHDILEMSEGLLYTHAQSAVQIFGTLLKKVFKQDLSKELPARILPISTLMPQDLNILVSSDLDGIRALLGKKKRREEEAEARLRPYQVIEENLNEIQGSNARTPSMRKLISRMKGGEWRPILPMVAGLAQSTSTGIPISLHVTKHEGFPVKIDPNASSNLAFRFIKPEDKYPFLTMDLAKKLDISIHKLIGLLKLFGLKGKEDFHMEMKISKTGHVQRYSEKAYMVLRRAIDKDGIESLWQAYKNKTSKKSDDYL